MQIIIVWVAATFLQPAVPAQPLAAVNGDGCEIHIWPAPHLNSLTEGAIWNNVLDSAFTPHPGRIPERQAPARGSLDPLGQLKLIDAIDLPTLLHMQGATLVPHEGESTRRAATAADKRQTVSTSPCYAEVTVAKNFFNRSSLTDRTLRTLLIFDDYRDKPQPVRTFVAWGTTPLHLYPAKRPEQSSAADAELATAFQENVRKFAGYAFAPPRKK